MITDRKESLPVVNSSYLTRIKALIDKRSAQLENNLESANFLLQEIILLKPEEVSEILQISKSMVYKLIRRGLLPAVHIGKTVRVKPSELTAFIHTNTSTKGES
jgi:excisionase family DNA binding protein